jgi:hypothetical protein
VWFGGTAISILHHQAASGATVSIADFVKKLNYFSKQVLWPGALISNATAAYIRRHYRQFYGDSAT